jgi:hypothetical protein
VLLLERNAGILVPVGPHVVHPRKTHHAPPNKRLQCARKSLGEEEAMS